MLKRQLYNVLHGSSSSSSSSEGDDDSEIESESASAPSEDEQDEDQQESPEPRSKVKSEEPREEKPVLQIKGVFKCKLCPKTICFTEPSLQAHLQSKGHARALKKQAQGKLKTTLNSDGEEEVLESDGETHAERHARILALAQDLKTKKSSETKKTMRGRQRQRQRKRARKLEHKASKVQDSH